MRIILLLSLILVLPFSWKVRSLMNKESQSPNSRKSNYCPRVDLEILEMNLPPSLEVYFAIRKYSSEYEIPLKYALGVAYAETRYKGPFHWKYNQVQESYAGALGPMQVMPGTAKGLLRKVLERPEEADNLTPQRLAEDIDLNVELSMCLLRRLYDKHGDWKLVFGAYNTGKPCVNGYAQMVYHYVPKIDLYEIPIN